MNKGKLLATLTAAVIAAGLSSGLVQAQSERTQLGVLNCEVEGGVGLLLGSSKPVHCTFNHANGTVEHYTGKSGKVGLDIGVTGKKQLSWVVFTPVGNTAGKHALQGDYVGIGAGGSLGIGLGANALVGGSGKTIGLQPVSIETGTGLNIAAGVSTLSLRPAS